MPFVVPGAAPGSLTVAEADGSPSGAASVLVLPNTTLAISGGTATYTPTSTSGIIVQEEGSTVGTATVINFVGSSVTATFSGGTATITDSGGGAASFVGAKAYHSTTQNTNNSTAALNLDSEEFDTNGFHDTSSNTSRMTIPSGQDGKYLILGATFASASADHLRLRKNGSTFLRGGSQNVTAAGRWNVSTIEDLVATDYVELVVASTPSVDWGFASADAATTLSITRLG